MILKRVESQRVDSQSTPESRPERAARSPIDVRNAALTILAVLAIVVVLKTAQAVIIPIVLGILISYALDPPVTWMTRLHLPRPLAAAMLLATLVAGGCWLLYGVRFEAAAIVDKLPQAARRVRQSLEHDRPKTATAIEQVQKAATELEKAADAAATPPPAPAGVTRVQVESTPFNVTDYVVWGSIGMEQAAVWGLLAGIFNSIPYFGPVVVTAGTAAAGFVQFGTIKMAAIVGGISLVITSLEGYLLTPWLTSRGSRMNAVAIFIGLLFWGWVWNIWGMLLAVPMMMVLKAVCDHIEDFKEVGELLGE